VITTVLENVKKGVMSQVFRISWHKSNHFVKKAKCIKIAQVQAHIVQGVEDNAEITKSQYKKKIYPRYISTPNIVPKI
jgi:hypothetical protein